MTDQELSRMAGKSYNFLSEVKARQPDKYKIMKEIGIVEYENRYRILANKLADLYYDKPHYATLYKFNGLDSDFPTVQALRVFVVNRSFSNIENSPRYQTMLRMEKVIKAYEEYLGGKYGKVC